jgi:hypothetical protein
MERISLHPLKRRGPLFESAHFKDTKDPCIVYDGAVWHIYGSGGNISKEEWHILHATAERIEGPWKEQDPVILQGLQGKHVAAPSVMYDSQDKLFHMAIQEDFMNIGGGVEYLVSADGKRFTRMDTLLKPLSGGSEAGLYDPHFSVIGNKKYLVYSGIPSTMPFDRPFIPQPDVYLAESESGTWAGPWKRIKKILDHDDIAWHHNKREHPDYEWGIEGPQLIELPGGKVLLNATCFLEEGGRGTRQRVFFALADMPEGPYKSIGPVLSARDEEWESGENGHASACIEHDLLYLFYQARSRSNPDGNENHWRYGIAEYSINDIAKFYGSK